MACYAIMNLIEMEAQKNKEVNSVEELKKYITAPDTILEGNRDIGFDPIPTVTDPCEGCETKKMLSQGINYIGDLPCQWCSKNPLRFQCIDGATTTVTTNNSGTYTTHTLKDRKGETNNG